METSFYSQLPLVKLLIEKDISFNLMDYRLNTIQQRFILHSLKNQNYNGLLLCVNPQREFWKYVNHSDGSVIRDGIGIIAFHGALSKILKHPELQELFLI